MQVKLIQANERLTPQGHYFSEDALRAAIAKTKFPLISWVVVERPPLPGRMDRSFDMYCSSMKVEDGWLVGEVEFHVTPNRVQEKPDLFNFFARVWPDDEHAIRVDPVSNSYIGFHYSSIGYNEK